MALGALLFASRVSRQAQPDLHDSEPLRGRLKLHKGSSIKNGPFELDTSPTGVAEMSSPENGLVNSQPLVKVPNTTPCQLRRALAVAPILLCAGLRVAGERSAGTLQAADKPQAKAGGRVARWGINPVSAGCDEEENRGQEKESQEMKGDITCAAP